LPLFFGLSVSGFIQYEFTQRKKSSQFAFLGVGQH
jgi:hypothetical protein